MKLFLIENETLNKMHESELEIVSDENNQLWFKEKEMVTRETEFIGKFESKEMAAYIAKEIQAETGIESKVEGDFLNKGLRNKYLFKNDTQELMKIGEFFISFDQLPSNVLYQKFKTKEEVEKHIKENGILNLYNDWLDWIGSDTIANKVGKYYVGKVVEETKNMYIVEYEEKQEGENKMPRFGAVIDTFKINVDEHLAKYGMKVVWESRHSHDVFVIEGDKTLEEVKNIPYLEHVTLES